MNNKHNTDQFLQTFVSLFRFGGSHHQGVFSRFVAVFCIWLSGPLLLSGCKTLAEGTAEFYQESLSANEQWAVIPFTNRSTEMPDDFSVQLERIVRVQLPSKGVASTAVYQQPRTTIRVPGTAKDAYNLERTRVWAISNGIRYTISGDVHKWQHDEEMRFSISLGLHVFDLDSGEEVWSIDGMATGDRNESAYDVSRKLIVDLLAAMPIGQ